MPFEWSYIDMLHHGLQIDITDSKIEIDNSR